MKVICLVGMKETGKTTKVKLILSQFPANIKKEIYDPNRHYEQSRNETFENFCLRIKNANNSVLVIEEATTLLRSKKRLQIIEDLLVRCRHQKNFVLLVFHSFRSLPTWIIDEMDAIYIFKTMDTENSVRKIRGIRGVYEAFENACKSKERHFCQFIDFRPL